MSETGLSGVGESGAPEELPAWLSERRGAAFLRNIVCHDSDYTGHLCAVGALTHLPGWRECAVCKEPKKHECERGHNDGAPACATRHVTQVSHGTHVASPALRCPPFAKCTHGSLLCRAANDDRVARFLKLDDPSVELFARRPRLVAISSSDSDQRCRCTPRAVSPIRSAAPH